MPVVLSFLRSRKKAPVTVGVEMLAKGYAFTALDQTAKVPRVVAMSHVSCDADQLQGALSSWLSEHQIESALCHFVLARDAYQLLLVEPPEVEPQELRSAIRWRLKDLISSPPDETALEVFPLPDDGTKANKKMVYVVAAQLAKLKQIIGLVQRCRLHLQSIDIGELALRNISLRVLDEEQFERGVAIVRLGHNNGSVYIYRLGNLYLARSFSLDYNAGLLDELPQDALGLELQRSLDYYERQMGQVPPAAILLCGEHISADKISTGLQASTSIPMRLLDPAQFISFTDECEADQVQFCVGALGAALRQAESN